MVTARDALVVLDDLRSSPDVFGRAKILRKGYEVLRELTPGDRRDLMVALAGRAAPDAIAHIESRTGQEVDRTMVADALTMLARLEPEDIAELTAELGDVESRTQLFDDVASAAGRAAASAAGIDLAPEVTFTTADPQDADAPASAAEDARPEAPEPEEERTPAHATTEDVAAVSAETPAHEAAHVADPPRPEPIVTPRPAVPAALVVPRRPAEPAEPAWSSDLRTAVDGGRAVRAFRRHLDAIADAPVAAQVSALHLVPDGWARRRCLDALVRADAIRPGSTPDLLATLAAPRDRRLVAGTLVADDPDAVDGLAGLIDGASMARLHRRTQRQARAWT